MAARPFLNRLASTVLRPLNGIGAALPDGRGSSSLLARIRRVPEYLICGYFIIGVYSSSAVAMVVASEWKKSGLEAELKELDERLRAIQANDQRPTNEAKESVVGGGL